MRSVLMGPWVVPFRRRFPEALGVGSAATIHLAQDSCMCMIAVTQSPHLRIPLGGFLVEQLLTLLGSSACIYEGLLLLELFQRNPLREGDL